MSLMYDDYTFKNSWVERKRGITPGNVDERAIYLTPPNLKKVQWKFWDFDLSKGPSVYSQEEVSFDDDIETEFSGIGSGSDGEGEGLEIV
jgi:hypothetical protein